VFSSWFVSSLTPFLKHSYKKPQENQTSNSARTEKPQEGVCSLKYWETTEWFSLGERPDLIYISKALKNNLKL